MNFWFQIEEYNCYTDFVNKGSIRCLKTERWRFPYGTG